MPEINDLSERELEILSLVATGASNKEIAHQLHISANTVKVHLRNIFTKIEVSSRTEAAMFAVSNGLVEGLVPVVEEEDEIGGLGRPSNGPLADSAGAVPLQPDRSGRRWAGLLAAGLVFVFVLFGTLLWARQGTPAAENPSAPAVINDPARWQSRAELPTARAGLAIVAYEGAIYALAGESETGVSGVLERYDPERDAWETLAEKPTPVTGVGAAVLGGKLYAPGGQTGSGEVSTVVEIFDPRTGEWAAAAPLPEPRSAYSLVAFEGKLYVFGGWDGETYSDAVYEYSPETDRWVENTPLPSPRAYTGAVVANGRIHVLGGYDGALALADHLRYAPEDEGSQDPWHPQAELPQGRYAMGVATAADLVYLVGGLGDAEAPLPRLEYVQSADRWEKYESGQATTWSHGGLATVGTDLHLLGGLEDGTISPLHLAFQAIYLINMPAIIQE